MTKQLIAATTIPALQVLHFGPCELRPDTRELLVDGQKRLVRRRVFDLMAYLIAQRPRTVSHAELLRQVWQRTGVSTKMVARAVMEARRACDDPADAPRLFASMHGVGYRFVGVVAAGPARAEDSAPADQNGVPEIRDLLGQANAALDAGQLAQAQYLAERALVQAEQARSQSERVRALVLCSALAMRRGTAASAATLAAQAVQIARSEGDGQLVAQAQMAVAFVHLVAGDRAVAIRHLEACRDAFSAAGLERDLVRCLTRLAMAFCDIGKPETGLQICRSALALARKINAPGFVRDSRTNEVMFLIRIGYQQDEQGAAQAARVTFEEALVLVDALAQDLALSGTPSQRQAALGNRAFLLEKLGRLDEAWQMLAEIERDVDLSSQPDGPVVAERRQITQMLRATLLARAGQSGQALEQLRGAVQAAQARGQHGMLVRLHGMATDIAQRAGQFEQALGWARQRIDAQTAQHASQAAALTCILEAELNTDTLQADLLAARDQMAALRQDNADLRQRVTLLEASIPVARTTGLAGAEFLRVVFEAPHRHARARGLPMCVGLLDMVNVTELGAAHAPEVLPALLRHVAELLCNHTDVMHPAVEVGMGRVAFHIRDVGTRRATEICADMLQRLRRQDWARVGLHLAPGWRCMAADAALLESIELCVQQLAARQHLPEASGEAAAAPVLPAPA